MEVPLGIQISQDMDYIEFFEASLNHVNIQNHKYFESYKKDYENCKPNNKYHKLHWQK